MKCRIMLLETKFSVIDNIVGTEKGTQSFNIGFSTIFSISDNREIGR